MGVILYRTSLRQSFGRATLVLYALESTGSERPKKKTLLNEENKRKTTNTCTIRCVGRRGRDVRRGINDL